MDPNIITIIVAVAALVAGIIAGKFIFAKDTRKRVEEAELQAQSLIKEAELRSQTIRKEKELEAKERFVHLKSEHDKEVLERNRKIIEGENRVKQKELNLNQKTEQLERQMKENDAIKQNLNRQLEVVSIRQAELEKHQEEHTRRLEKISGLTAEEAKAQLVESLKQEAHTQALGLQQEIIDEAKQKANKEARKIIIQTIQRTAAEQAIENSITVFNLESDEIKGQIIGREGRNIRAIEAATGVDLIVDDTPETVLISSHSPIRREIARVALERLISDGRIHPGRIEEVVKKAEQEVEESVRDAGQRAVLELGVHGVHPEIIKLVGMLKYRYSYGQNVLMHSIETAYICGVMAAELGLNEKQARRAGLL